MAIIHADIFLHAERCHELLRKAEAVFEDYIQKRLPAKAPEYYQARNFLREGQALYEDILKKAKALLGPVPPYSPPDYEQQRVKTLAENKIIVRGQSLESIRDELLSDGIVSRVMTPDEVIAYLKSHFLSQGIGKRRLANIKVRMIIDALKNLSSRVQELRVQAQNRFQSEGG